MYRRYYTLRRKSEYEPFNYLIYPGEYDTYDEAYDKMVNLYLESNRKLRFDIWVTNVHGNNSMTQQTWG